MAGALSMVAACAGQGSAEDANATAAALAFSRSLTTATQDACALLAPRTLEELEATAGPCREALPAELTAVSSAAVVTQVYGKDAVVRTDADTIFLALFAKGWRVTAAGCTRPEPGRPYDCKVKGT